MSRWVNEFNAHPFKESWANLVAAIDTLDVDDQTVTSTVEEVARLKKASTFINTVVQNLDLDLTPKSVWANSHSQTNPCLQQVNTYKSNRNVDHLVAANDHIDNILTYVRPYMLLPEQTLKATGDAAKVYIKLLARHVRSFREGSAETKNAISEMHSQSATYLKEMESTSTKIKAFDTYLFYGIDGNEPAEKYLKDMVSTAKTQHDEIENLHTKLLIDPESTDKAISDFEDRIRVACKEIEELKESSKSEHRELTQFHTKVFGNPQSEDSEDNNIGLEKELDRRMNQLTEIAKDQLKRHDAIFEKVESLLPGATSARLASAYKALKDKFSQPIETYTKIFYTSLAGLLIIGFFAITESLQIWPFKITFVEPGDWTEMLRTLLMRLPIILPVAWLAIFSATRRSQYERLQQEYSHKEAFASSYDSYKQQLRQLSTGSEDLEKELLAKAIEAVSYNASKTLDAKSSDETPIRRIIEIIELRKLAKSIDGDKTKSS